MSRYDRSFWEERWSQALQDHGDVALRPANAHLTGHLGGLPPGRALDAGCGHGAESIWLAGHGWEVTGVDFSPTALAQARSTADALGEDVAGRIEWVEADLHTWTPPAEQFDLVVSLYVHVEGSTEKFVQRVASAVKPGGTLFLVGHHPLDQNQVTVDDAIAALEDEPWEIAVAEERERADGNGVDAVFYAERPSGRF